MPDIAHAAAGPQGTLSIARRPFMALLGGGLVAGALAPAHAAAPAASPAAACGKVTRIRGEARALRLRGATASLREGAPVFPLDLLRTAKETRLEVTFTDESKLTLGDDSELQIDTYVFDPARSEGQQFLGITQGVFRMVTGNVAKLAGSPFRVRTPVATIGVRGTDFWGFQDARKLDLALLGGAGLYAQNGAGWIDITQPRGLTTITGFDQRPTPVRVLSEQEIAVAAQTVTF
ncbi:MAG: FecR domain-containing protein [Alphaproteobacteria bacterium]|nr:FecR domain-containing protein [Alphaproteobacteria bacterium]